MNTTTKTIFICLFCISSLCASDAFVRNADDNASQLRNTDMFVLRLFSDPESEVRDHLHHDLDFWQWSKGFYGPQIRGFGVPFTNVVHFTMETSNPRYEVAKGGHVTRLLADLTSENFSLLTEELLNNLGSTTKRFNLMITNSNTSRFIKDENVLYNLLSMLSIGGTFIATDLDTEHNFLDLVFKTINSETISFRDLTLKIKFSDISAFTNRSLCVFLLRLGNISFNPKADRCPHLPASRTVSIERLK